MLLQIHGVISALVFVQHMTSVPLIYGIETGHGAWGKSDVCIT